MRILSRRKAPRLDNQLKRLGATRGSEAVAPVERTGREWVDGLGYVKTSTGDDVEQSKTDRAATD